MVDFDNVLAIMQSKGITQKQLADKIGVSEQKISDWKSGRIKSYMKYLNKIAEVLDVSIDELSGVEPKETPAENIGGLKKHLFELMADLTPAEEKKLLDYYDLLKAARRKKSDQ